jgi:hypothetical protein
MHWKRDRDEVRAEAALHLERTSDTDISGDREDPSLSLEWKRANPRGEFRLSGVYEEASTRITELNDTGRLFADGTRTVSALGSGWNHYLSERSQISLTGLHSQVRYDGGDFTDYDLAEADLNYSFSWNASMVPYVLLSAARYEPETQLDNPSERYRLMPGLQFSLGENVDLDVSGGAVQLEGESSDSDWNASALLHYTGERSRLELKYARTTESSGAGGFTSADTAFAQFAYEYSERTSYGVSGYWRKNRSLDLAESAVLEIWASRKLTAYWTCRLSSQFKRRDGREQSHAQVVSLSFNYRLPERL